MKAEKILLSTLRARQPRENYLDSLVPFLKNQLDLIAYQIDHLRAALQRLERRCEQHKRGSIDLDQELRLIEISLIQMALSKTQGHQRRAAAFLRIKPTTLNAKIKKYAIQYRTTEPKESTRAFAERRQSLHATESDTAR